MNYEDLLISYRKDIILFFIYKGAGKETAEDLYHDIFIKVKNKIEQGKYVEKGRFKNWVISMASNHYIDTLRNKNKKKTVPFLYKNGVNINERYYAGSFESTIEEDIVEKEMHNYKLELMETAIETLKPDMKEALFLFFFEGYKVKEIAEILDISISTALGRIRYAKIGCKKFIEKSDSVVKII